jgi:uncharacterized membrane protein
MLILPVPRKIEYKKDYFSISDCIQIEYDTKPSLTILGIKKLFKNKVIAIVSGAVAGTLTNTIGVLGMIYILYARRYVDALVQSAQGQGKTLIVKSLLGVIFGGVFINAVAEIVMASLICLPVTVAVEKIKKTGNN